MDLQVTHPLNIKFNCDEHEGIVGYCITGDYHKL